MPRRLCLGGEARDVTIGTHTRQSWIQRPAHHFTAMNFQTFRDLVLTLSDHAAVHGEGDCLRLLGSALAELSAHRAHLNEADDKREMAEFRALLHPILLQSEFGAHVFHKPRGHAGDYVTQEMIWFGRVLGGEHRYRGTTPLGKLLTSLTLDMPNCVANVARVRALQAHVNNGANRLASIGCGSCIEFWEQERMEEHDVFLLDQDQEALDRARVQIGNRIGKVAFARQNVLKFILRSDSTNDFNGRDLVYASGLFDYFDQGSAIRLTRGLWPLVAPGGCLLIINEHPSNPSRLWMEYVGDWFLKYKNEAQMRELAEGLEGVASTSLTLDDQHVYQYLETRKHE